MKNYLLVLLLLLSSQIFSQTKSNQVEIKGGKKYYVHTVEKGVTLFAIKRLYDVSVEDIMAANPGSEEGIKEGQALYIPYKDSDIKSTSTKDIKYTEHEVKAEETLYGISKIYNVSIDEILKLNPEASNGLKKGEIIKIPGAAQQTTEIKNTIVERPIVTNNNLKDTIINYTVQDGETLYSISKRYMVEVEVLKKMNNLASLNIQKGLVLKIPVKAENRKQLQIRPVDQNLITKIDSLLLFKKKEKYNICVLLPLNLDRGPGYNAAITQYALEFWMGAQLAIDTLIKNGMKAEIFLHDTKHDSSEVMNILSTEEAKTYDIIIGPLFKNHITFVADWCKENAVRMICPVAIPTNVLLNNPYVTAIIPSDMALMEKQAEYVLKTYKNQTIILIKPTTPDDILAFEAFREKYISFPVVGTKPKLIEATLDNFTNFMSSSTKNILIMPSTDKATSGKFISTLNKSGKGKVVMFGMKDWTNMDEIKGETKNKYNFHFASPYDFNYSYLKTKNALKKFRRKFNYDFTKMAALGYDVMMYTGFNIVLNKTNTYTLMTKIDIKETIPGSGNENKSAYIFYQEDFELYNIEVPREKDEQK